MSQGFRKVERDHAQQVDLLFDRNDKTITLCEIKFSEKPFTINKDYAKKIINKREVFIKRTKTQRQIFITLITSSGIKENPYSDELISGVVTLDDLFKEIS